jgi:hypothetical protein
MRGYRVRFLASLPCGTEVLLLLSLEVKSCLLLVLSNLRVFFCALGVNQRDLLCALDVNLRVLLCALGVSVRVLSHALGVTLRALWVVGCSRY